MCGFDIFVSTTLTEEQVTESTKLISYRGPDDLIVQRYLPNVILGFARLRINGLNEESNQPLIHNNLMCIANAEIFNYKELALKYDFNYKTQSDCESLLHLYEKLGLLGMLNEIDGEFAGVIIDKNKNELIAFRDPIGIRPLFAGTMNMNGKIAFASELKAIQNYCEFVLPFQPGCYMKVDLSTYKTTITKYYSMKQDYYSNILYDAPTMIGEINDNQVPITKEVNEIQGDIVKLLETSVKRRLLSDRPLGLFISGGLDSSLIASIACKYSKEKLHSFAIGLKDYPSSDLKYAKEVADYLGTIHHEINFTLEEGLNAIKEVIYHLESYDITTIRASVPMYLLSKWISKNTDVKVLLTGESPDESMGGYLYFHYAPSQEEFQKETERRVKELYIYDVLRSDRTTAAHGLEVRVPYLAKYFLNYIISLDPKYKDPKYNNNIEKHLLRSSFNGYIPDSVLWRPKEAFSDGVGYSWKQSIADFAEKQISDEEYSNRYEKYSINTPYTKEAYYYRKIFEEYYPNCDHLIKEIWQPKWNKDGEIDTSNNPIDPSATVLDIHSEKHK